MIPEDEALDRAILALVAKADERLTWYQIDRSLSNDPRVGPIYRRSALRLTQTLTCLVGKGLLVEVPGPNASQPRYKITASGVSLVKLGD